MKTKDTARRTPSEVQLTLVTLLVTLAFAWGATGSPAQARPLFASGDLDLTFSGDGKVLTRLVSGHAAFSEAVALQPDGKIVAVGSTTVSSLLGTDLAVVRYRTSGSLDPTFSGDGKFVLSLPGYYDAAHDVDLHQATGKVVVVGDTCPKAGDCNAVVLRFNPGGGLDTTFHGTGKRIDDFGGGDNRGRAVAVYPGGRIITLGWMYNNNRGNYDFGLTRYTLEGALDPTFSGDGKQVINFSSGTQDYGSAVAIQPDGKVVAAGYSCGNDGFDCKFALARLNENGSLDTGFSGDGKQVTSFGGESYVYGMALHPDGKIVLSGKKVVGVDESFALARYNANGSLDMTFNGTGKIVRQFTGYTRDAYASSVRIQQPGGKIVVCGSIGNSWNDHGFVLMRYTYDGAPDTTFSGDGKTIVNLGVNAVCNALEVQTDGKYVAVGTRIVSSVDTVFLVARVLP